MRPWRTLPNKLALMIGVLSLIAGGIWAVSFFAMDTLSSMRAYVGGEGLWSKAQKQAVYSLFRYATTRDEKDFWVFLQRLEVPMGDKQARLELEKDDPQWHVIEQGFLKGGNHPRDLKGMAVLFRRFRSVGYMDRAIQIWSEGDRLIQELYQVGHEIHRRIRTGRLSAGELDALLERVDAINSALIPLEDAFSATLGDAARYMKRVIGQVQTAAIFAFFSLGCWMVFRLSRQLSEEKIYRLNQELARRIEQLDAANKELDCFCYSVSHDLRAPLRALRGFSDILVEDHGAQLPAPARKLVGDLRRNAERMAQLIEGLLSFSRLSLQPLATMPVDMRALARAVSEELRAQEKGRDITITVDPMEPVQGDPTLLRQVWVNLIGNAVKFTRPSANARIHVKAHREGARQVFVVQDNGVGFDTAMEGKLFGVFQRLHTADEFEGTGVGLALVKRIVTRHGGTVWARAVPNEGAAFYFALPRTGRP